MTGKTNRNASDVEIGVWRVGMHERRGELHRLVDSIRNEEMKNRIIERLCHTYRMVSASSAGPV